jgi:hypothetical protein
MQIIGSISAIRRAIEIILFLDLFNSFSFLLNFVRTELALKPYIGLQKNGVLLLFIAQVLGEINNNALISQSSASLGKLEP